MIQLRECLLCHLRACLLSCGVAWSRSSHVFIIVWIERLAILHLFPLWWCHPLSANSELYTKEWNPIEDDIATIKNKRGIYHLRFPSKLIDCQIWFYHRKEVISTTSLWVFLVQPVYHRQIVFTLCASWCEWMLWLWGSLPFSCEFCGWSELQVFSAWLHS